MTEKDFCDFADFDDVTNESYYCLLAPDHDGPHNGYWEMADDSPEQHLDHRALFVHRDRL